jgi:hypothetical protein
MDRLCTTALDYGDPSPDLRAMNSKPQPTMYPRCENCDRGLPGGPDVTLQAFDADMHPSTRVGREHAFCSMACHDAWLHEHTPHEDAAITVTRIVR